MIELKQLYLIREGLMEAGCAIPQDLADKITKAEQAYLSELLSDRVLDYLPIDSQIDTTFVITAQYTDSKLASVDVKIADWK